MIRLLRRATLATLAFGLVVWGVFATSEARRTAGRNQRLVAEIAQLEVDLAAARAARVDDAAAHEQALAAWQGRVREVESELARALEQAAVVNSRLDERRRELEALQRGVDERWRHARRPMPEGVRLAVAAVCERLREDGFHGLRVLRAAALEDGALREVELIERSDDGIDFAYYRAGALRAVLDRASGTVELRLAGGHVLRGGEVEDVEADNERIILLPRVDGRAWEAELPYLLTVSGEYPEQRDATPARPRIDPITAAAWAARLDRLLDEADTTPHWTVRRLRDLVDGEFVELSLTGTGAGGLLESTIRADRGAVEIDRAQGTVWLALRNGTLRRRGGTTTIPAAGYRILLAGVTPDRADRILLGMHRSAGGGAADGN